MPIQMLTAPVRQALVRDAALLQEALISGLVDPAEIDGANPLQMGALMAALKCRSDLPAPVHLLARLQAEHLWHLVAHPDVSRFLTARLTRQIQHAKTFASIVPDPTTGLPANSKDIFTSPGSSEPFCPEITAVFDRILDLPAIPEEFLQHLVRTGFVGDPAVRAKAHALILAAEAEKRSASAKKAAATRRTRAAGGNGVPPPKEDPLALAIASDDTRRLRHFCLETLTPERVATVLPAWLAAGIQMRQWVLAIPHVPAEALLPALEAWGLCQNIRNAITHAPCRYPIPGSLLADLSVEAAVGVFHHSLAQHPHYPGDLHLDPAPTPAEIASLLFRISLEYPSIATTFQQALRLRALMQAVSTYPAAPPPEDPEATWVVNYLKNTHMVEPDTALALETLFQGWPPDRQAALAPALAAANLTTPLHVLLSQVPLP